MFKRLSRKKLVAKRVFGLISEKSLLIKLANEVESLLLLSKANGKEVDTIYLSPLAFKLANERIKGFLPLKAIFNCKVEVFEDIMVVWKK